MTGLLGRGVLANWGGITDDAEVDYNAWHSLEHMPERLAIPGFRRGRRCIAVDGVPQDRRYFMMYETDEIDTLASAPYLARLNDPTPWTTRVLSAYVAPSRTVCRVLQTRGRGVGGWLATYEFNEPSRDDARGFAVGGWLDLVCKLDGVLGAHALEGDPQFGQQPTKEKTFREARGDKDVTVAIALLVEGMDRKSTETAMAALDADMGALRADRVTLYETQHVLSDADAHL
ncbi:hypothetical protein D5400_03545 [Georhizobium profundi]|uniref:Uncharacterized protein n=1 Tax=Georhizobium profundi TaxID=2341112 RepID=A0A3Q8XLK8_9HYPH|nr:hypothetical protein [Georhizobium profundi]AZN70470.1 hypothetical protein D5400_03545 [Georhizobium profundi]